MRVTFKGQVTIPGPIRKKFGILPGTEVEIMESNGQMVLKKDTFRSPVDRVYGILKNKTPWKKTDDIIELLRGRL